MSLIKFNSRTRMFPSWIDNSLRNMISRDDFFNDDFFEEDSLMPAMNVKENEENFEIELAAPGFSKKDFEVTIDHNMLNVTGKKKNEFEEKEEDYTRKEFNYSSFKRSLSLPKTVNIEKEVQASYKNGILKLNLQKKEEAKAQPKKVIEIQ